jgi:hypothetical protein
MIAFDAQMVNLYHIDPVRVSYDPKGIHAEAIQATIQNIGKLALEFESEILHSNGMPYFGFWAARGNKQEPQDQEDIWLTVRLTDWIIPLRGEIHVYRDELFVNTFTFDDERPPTSYTIPRDIVENAQHRVAEEKEFTPFTPGMNAPKL